MRTLLFAVYRTLQLSAWILVVLASALIVVEESGLLTRAVERALVWSIGPAGRGVRIEQARLRWFEPSLVLEGVHVHAPASTSVDPEATGESRAAAPREPLRPPAAGAELVALHRVEVSFRVDRSRPPISHITVDGGSLAISPSSWEGLQRLGELLDRSSRPVEATDSPPILVTNLAIALELPDGEPVSLGVVELHAHPESGVGLALTGALRPVLSGAVQGAHPIRVEGLLEGATLELSASTGGLSLETRELVVPPSLGDLPVAEFSGTLALLVRGSIQLAGELEVEGSLRARVDEARLLPRPGDPWLEELDLELAADFRPPRGADLWDPEAWDAIARLGARWNGTPVEAWAELGRRTERGVWARAFARAPRLPLTEGTLAAFGALDVARPHWEAFAPVGVADASLELTLRRAPGSAGASDGEAPGTARFEQRLAAHVRHIGESGMTFRGYRDGPDEEPWGVPVPVTDVRGQMSFVFDPAEHPADRLLLADMRGAHPTGEGHAWASIQDYSGKGELDVEFEVPEALVDEALMEVLGRSPITRRVPRNYDPRGGTCSTYWRLRVGPETQHRLTALGRVGVRGTRARWHGMPVPLHGCSGTVELLWAARRTTVRGTNRGYRPIGVRWDLSNRDGEGPGPRASVRGFYREESLPPEVEPEELPAPDALGVLAVDVDLEEVLLRGQNWQVLADAIPELGAWRDRLHANGGVGVRYEGARAVTDGPWISNVEAVPRHAELTPELFPRRTRELRGRILANLRDDDEGSAMEGRVVMAGAWPQGAELLAEAELPPDGEVRVRVLGAGIPPDNPAFLGALQQALAAEGGGGGEALAIGNLVLDGVVDAEVTALVRAGSEGSEESAEGETRTEHRLFLRGGSLRAGELRLEDLQGVVERSGSVLRSARVTARLTDHPIRLRDVVVAPRAMADALPEIDPVFLRNIPRSAVPGLVLHATLDAVDYPFDPEHLTQLLGAQAGPVQEAAARRLTEEESSVALGGDWEARVDLLGARVGLLTSEESAPRLMIRGPLRVRDGRLRFALPLEVESARIALEELVFERGGISAWGQIDDLQGRLAGRQLVDGRMVLGFVDRRLTIDDLEAGFAGGTIQSLGAEGPGSRKALGVDLGAPYRFDLAVEVSEVDVGRLLQGVFESSIADEGRLRGTLQLAGTPEDLLGLTGRGSLRLDDGRLWSIPAARELFSSLGFQGTAVFDRLRARFELAGGKIQTHFITVKSTLLNLVGQGWHDLDGRLAYDLDVRTGLLDNLHFLNRIIYWLSGNLVHVSVRGDPSRPEVRIRSSLLELFRGRPEEPPRRLPLPDFAPLGPRF